MDDQEQTTYDEIWYPNAALHQTHPDRLATLATLFGLNPAPVEACRVLELGCGDGGNLIPMAFGLPAGKFVGIDLAPSPIAKGQATVKALGLRHIALEKMDILDVSREFGEFDYIITHGIYSWVPESVREKILDICKTNLADEGVAYISYNAYPGCHTRNMMREMIAFHLREVHEPTEQINEARAFVKFLAESESEPTAYKLFLEKQFEDITRRSDGAFYHDDLSAMNQPFYFHQFIADAERHGLQYLSEANIQDIQVGGFSPQVASALNALGKQSIIAKEQYLDFLKGKQFRQTLVCHQSRKLNRDPKPDLMQSFFATSSARPASEKPNLRSGDVEAFTGKNGAAMQTGYPLAKAAIFALGQAYPQSLGFNELLKKSLNLLGFFASQEAQYASALGKILLQTYEAGLIDLHTYQPRFTATINEYPVASPLARLQIADGNSTVTNLRHESIKVEDEMSKQLLVLLDGTRDRDALINALHQASEANAESNEALAENVELRLKEIAQLALLIQ
jgi:methyltransferase-like protein/SAM-dependent methyltransferase